ncbi:response regulator [Sorangium sp. So ce1036]|uniref:response regulator n=1 Tax=Sorangium sp. So ce1036 TaxID=3133328 RepID=UPI003EFE4871
MDGPAWPVATVIAALLGLVFVADLVTPLGIASWVLYLVPFGLCLYAGRPGAPLATAGAASALLAAGMLVSMPGHVGHAVAQVNRVLGFVAVWSTAFFVRRSILAQLALRREDWLQQGRALLSERVQGDLTVSEIGERALGFLAEYLDARAGALYAEQAGGSLRRVAAWALGPDELDRQHVLRRGEGLLGQAARDRRALVLRDLPEHHMNVVSALGASRPRHAVIAPSTADGEVVAATELGFLRPVHGVDLELLERVAEPLGVALRSATYRATLERLLAQTQEQTEELKVQQEKLRASNEELEQQAAAMREAQARLESQQAELEQTNVQLEEHALALGKQREELLAAQRAMLESVEALGRANQYKSEFLANMSHELRTPLNSALILARLLADNKEGNLSPEQVRFAATIHAAGSDLLELINDILDLSKIEAGRVDVRPEPAALLGITGALEQAFSPVARDRELSFRVEVAPGAPGALYTDVQRLQQILKNLLANAFKFTERGGVVLEVAPERGGRVAFAVRDTGIGIPEDQHEVIFEGFRQADGTTNRKYGGTGLGLTISRELARLLGGDIDLESAPGVGSCFRVVIPAAYEVAQASPPDRDAPPQKGPSQGGASQSEPWQEEPWREGSFQKAPPPGSAAPGRPRAALEAARGEIEDDRSNRTRDGRLILVVEDDPAFARILYDVAHELDFDCVITPSAEEGLSLARSLTPSAVLLDIGLPDGSGLALLEQLKRGAATRHIPVHVISVSDCTQTALELGAVGYALKPVKREELVRAIRNLEDRLTRKERRVLVVEDDAGAREGICALLQGEGVEILAVGTAAAALDQLAAATFDCMILDLKLPDASGYDLLERMAGGELCSFPPVIVYTGRVLDPDEERRLHRYSRSIIIKGAKSPERLLDEVTLFLHQVESSLPPERQRMLREARHRESVFEGRRILLVEDDVRSIFALSSVFEPRGARLEVARNGREALEAMDRLEEVDLVLMDVMMPEMDGLTATRELRKRPELARLPIIALTAKAMPKDQQQCLQAGANDCMAKPIDVEKLLSLCRVWIRK